MAAVGDWVVGTGGKSSKSAGHGRMIYAMRLTEKIPLLRYATARRFARRVDRDPSAPRIHARFVLISDDFFYFGRNAIDIKQLPTLHLPHRFEKRGPGYRKDFPPHFVADFDAWLHHEFTVGVHGPPCAPYSPLWNAAPRPGCARRRAAPRCPPKHTRPRGPC